MARGGNNRISKAEAERRGTKRDDRHVDPVVIDDRTVVKPSHLQGPAAEVWDEWIAPRLVSGVYDPADAAGLALWCITYVRILGADKATPLAGIYEIEDEYGRVAFKKHPGLTAMKDMLSEFRGLSARLGLDPLARIALSDVGKKVSNEKPSLPDGAPAKWQPKVIGE